MYVISLVRTAVPNTKCVQITARHFTLPPAEPISNQQAAIFSVNEAVTNHSSADVRCNLYRLMSNSSNMNYISTKLWDLMRNESNYDNMEAIHDAIHRAVGGDWWNDGLGVGTMYWTQAAAFDPIFWMHHAMVDRLFAMWQVLHPDNWLIPAYNTETWTLWEEDEIDGNTRQSTARPNILLSSLLTRSSFNALPC
jgi:hypothetical protein